MVTLKAKRFAFYETEGAETAVRHTSQMATWTVFI
jgi:hypothetical protein